MYVCMYTYVPMCIYTYVHMYIRMYIYIQARTQGLREGGGQALNIFPGKGGAIAQSAQPVLKSMGILKNFAWKGGGQLPNAPLHTGL